jgi:hypothetical protein
VGRLKNTFHQEEKGSEVDPGFDVSVAITKDTLDASYRALKKNDRAYALSRLRFVAQECIGCHTRFEAPDILEALPNGIQGLPDLQQGELFLASRQFSKAEEALKQAFYHGKKFERLDAVRKLLILYTRVKPNLEIASATFNEMGKRGDEKSSNKNLARGILTLIHPDPRVGLLSLQRIRQEQSLIEYEREQIDEWIAGLERWAKEKKQQVSLVTEAKRLINEAETRRTSEFSEKNSAVELLRATALLHKAVKDRVQDRAEVLYLLGRAYSHLPLFFDDQYSPFYLERCIREAPGTIEARKAFKLYRNQLTLGYTGSSGTHLPKAEVEKLTRLHELAYDLAKNTSTIKLLD